MAIQYCCDHCGAVAPSKDFAGPPSWHRVSLRYDPPTGHDLESLARSFPRRLEVHADTDACLQALVARIITLIRQTVASGRPAAADDE